jgi:hypothetical protein
MLEWNKSFQPPTAWTEPIATSYRQKRAMLETMKGAKGEEKDAKTQTGTTRKPAEVTPPPPVTNTPVAPSPPRPRFSSPYNYPLPGRASYPQVSANKPEYTWTPMANSASTLNPYFRQYAITKHEEPTAVPYWQRKLENPTASQQIRLINQSWMEARKPEPKEPSPAQREMLDSNVEEPKPEDPMAAAPTSIWLPKLPKLPDPMEEAAEPAYELLEPEGGEQQTEASEVVDLTEFQSKREHDREAADSYSSADKWVSLKDFDVPPEPDRYEVPQSSEPSADDLDWESMVRKPRMSRRRRRKAAEEWEPPSAELDFRDQEAKIQPKERVRERDQAAAEPEFELREPRRRGREPRRREPEPRFREEPSHREEPGYREPEPGYPEPEPGYREEPRYREPEPGYREEPRYREPAPRYAEPEPAVEEPDLDVRGPRRREPEPAVQSRVKASRNAMLVEDGLVYVLVDDEGRPVLQ